MIVLPRLTRRTSSVVYAHAAGLNTGAVKAIAGVVTAFLENRASRTNLRTLVRLLMILFGLIAIFSLAFHWLMAWEGRDHSWAAFPLRCHSAIGRVLVIRIITWDRCRTG